MNATTSEDTQEGEDGAPESLEEVEIHQILSSQRRYETLSILIDEGTVSVRDLADRVAEIESGEKSPDSNKRKSVYVSLHQTHIPKLDTLGVIEYDENTKEARVSDSVGEVIEKYMASKDTSQTGDVSEESGRSVRGSQIGVGASAISGLGVVSVILSYLGLPVVSVVSPWIYGVFFLSAVCVYTLSLSDSRGSDVLTGFKQ
ncbi:MAG: hypothetical protein SV253_02710 [Halobacteria archaeon]|nr:hypothetical protein [Halobacteria archaeon]